MDNKVLPSVISYTLLVHAGSYSTFKARFEKEVPNLEIVREKKKAIHYYIIQVREKKGTSTNKEDIYKLPLMSMREEFSNYLFFKSVKAYNNALKGMKKEGNEKDLPYVLYQEMITPLEKVIIGNIGDNVKSLMFKNVDSRGNVSVINIPNKDLDERSTLDLLFENDSCSIDGKDYNFKEEIKKESLKIGIR